MRFAFFMTTAIVLMGCGLAYAGAHEEGELRDCSESTEASVSAFCRNSTLFAFDRELIEPIQSLLKFDEGRYALDVSYAGIIDRLEDIVSRNLTADLEFDDRYGVLVNFISLDDPFEPRNLTELLKSFEALHAGCNFTLQRAGEKRISRSFLVAYLEQDLYKFAAIHVNIGSPERVHSPYASQRTPMILSVEVYPVVLGFPVSNHLMLTHILPSMSDKCSRIVDLMDQGLISELAERE
ncbi:MAG: hypothetical protein ABJQ34_01630 [Paracoccaceae bacterium]